MNVDMLPTAAKLRRHPTTNLARPAMFTDLAMNIGRIPNIQSPKQLIIEAVISMPSTTESLQHFPGDRGESSHQAAGGLHWKAAMKK
jgi:hypothetical protein